ncbi:helix-turn-helix domain-containing protein [Albibacterium indicum]|uniref:helix-turn-helix domain-containing protein n=1 Tax=Albibacterium indicum TaxID=2292082 RepID=UPI001FE260B7|nr:helix-turn-helix transcriptional regulator [Pedobacter indicus]
MICTNIQIFTDTRSGVFDFNLILIACMVKKPHASDVDIYLIERVKELRVEKGISQAQLAHLLDVSTGYIGHVESSKDRAKYNLNMLVKLAKVLECTYDDLLPPV